MQTIVCPNCNADVTQALYDQVVKQVSQEEKEKNQKEIEKVRTEEKIKAEKKVKEELELKLKELEEEKNSDKKRIEKLMQDVLKTNEEMRELKRKDEERELDNQKKLHEEREKIKEEITKTESERNKLKILEKDQQLEAMKKTIEELQRKAQQGSQQLQGEVLELQLEQSLRNAFSDDAIEPVAKGVKGADIKQIVKTARGNECGIILWELKRTKQWSDDWVAKLKQDMRAEKAHLSIIVSETLPEEAKAGFGHKDGVLVCSLNLALSVAEIMRQQLIAVARERFILEHKNNKTESEQLFDYITSHEFLQQIEALVELHVEMNMQIAKERAALEKIWKAREMQTLKIFKTTTAIAGSLQGIVGNSMPQIKGLELAELDSGLKK